MKKVGKEKEIKDINLREREPEKERERERERARDQIMAWFSKTKGKEIECPYLNLTLRIRRTKPPPEDIEKEISRFPSFDPCKLPISGVDPVTHSEIKFFLFPSILHTAIHARNFILAKSIIQKFPHLLNLFDREGRLPLFRLLERILDKIEDASESESMKEEIQLLDWCISSFPDSLNLMTENQPETPLYSVMRYLVFIKFKNKIQLEKAKLKIVKLCQMLINKGAVIIPSILPASLLPIREAWPSFSLTAKEVLGHFLPKPVASIVVGYSQDVWSFLMPFQENGKDWERPNRKRSLKLDFKMKVFLEHVLKKVVGEGNEKD